MDEIAPLNLTVYNPKGAVVYTQILPYSKSKFSYTTKEEGVFKICIRGESGDWVKDRSKIRYSIRLYSGENANYEDLANVEHLSQLQIMIMRLNDHAQDFIKMQEMNRQQESIQVEVTNYKIINI